MLAPPSIAKLNGDETYDIIAQNFDGKITALMEKILTILFGKLI